MDSYTCMCGRKSFMIFEDRFECVECGLTYFFKDLYEKCGEDDVIIPSVEAFNRHCYETGKVHP